MKKITVNHPQACAMCNPTGRNAKIWLRIHMLLSFSASYLCLIGPPSASSCTCSSQNRGCCALAARSGCVCFTAAQLALETALLPEAAAILTSILASEPSLPSRRVTNCPVTDEDGISMEMLIHLGIYCKELACSASWGNTVSGLSSLYLRLT